jgi:hypothetical protein
MWCAITRNRIIDPVFFDDILSRVCGFIGSHTVTHNYSVYTLQLTTVHHNTCRVSSLCLHWLPVFQYRRIRLPSELTCTSATLLRRLLLHCRLSTGQLDSQLTTNCSHSAGILTLNCTASPTELTELSESESRCDRRSVGQSVLVSSPIWGS